MAGNFRSVAAGNKYAYLGFYDTEGRFIGGNTSAPSAGAAGSGMYRILGIKSAPVVVPENDTQQSTGDDDLLADFAFASITSRAFQIEVAMQDLTLEQRLIGKSVETIAGGYMGYMDITDAPEKDACLIFQSRAKSQDDVSAGRKGWTGTLIPLATAQPLGRSGFDERGVATWRYSITPQLSAYSPWGVTFLDDSGVPFKARYRPFSFPYPVTMHAHLGTGSPLSFVLDQAPISVAYTAAYLNRVAQTLTSIDATARTMTPTATVGSNQYLTTFYQFNG